MSCIEGIDSPGGTSFWTGVEDAQALRQAEGKVHRHGSQRDDPQRYACLAFAVRFGVALPYRGDQLPARPLEGFSCISCPL